MSPTALQAVKSEYAQLAREYDRRWSRYVAATLRETVGRSNLKPTERLLDIGCGTGALLREVTVAHQGVMAVGVDVSTAMLTVARSKLRAEIPLIAGDAERLPFRAEAFDVVVSCSSFHYFPTPAVALAEIARVLRPTGCLIITDWCDDYLTCRLCDVCLQVFDKAYHRSYGRAECQRLLEDAGYDGVEIERYKINWLWGLMTASARAPGLERRHIAHGRRAAWVDAGGADFNPWKENRANV